MMLILFKIFINISWMYTEKYIIQTSSKSVNINQYIGNNKSLFIKIEIKRLSLKMFLFSRE